MTPSTGDLTDVRSTRLSSAGIRAASSAISPSMAERSVSALVTVGLLLGFQLLVEFVESGLDALLA
jgi:hypothetical protein